MCWGRGGGRHGWVINRRANGNDGWIDGRPRRQIPPSTGTH